MEAMTRHEHERLSVCCGAREIEGTGCCAQCREQTGFECDCAHGYCPDVGPCLVDPNTGHTSAF